jgi:hypothetical protein
LLAEPTAEGVETYALIPTRIRKGNQISKRIQRLVVVVSRSLRGRRSHSLARRGGLCSRWRRRGSRQCGGFLSIERANLELSLVLLEDALVVVFPELLAGVLAGYAREDLLAT